MPSFFPTQCGSCTTRVCHQAYTTSAPFSHNTPCPSSICCLCLPCLQVLLNAFGRALKDTFPPARVAALRAMVATVKYYGPDEMALRALPSVAPLCVDPLAGNSVPDLTAGKPAGVHFLKQPGWSTSVSEPICSELRFGCCSAFACCTSSLL